VKAQTTSEETLFEDVNALPLPVGERRYRGVPGDMLKLEDGRLLLTYSGRLPDGRAARYIAAKYSEDDGRTWGPEVTLVPTPEGKQKYAHPSLIRLRNGDILLSYIYRSGSTKRYGHNYYRRSTDDGKTWGDQYIVTPHIGYNLVHNDKFVQLSSGRILAPVAYEAGKPEDDHGGYVSYTAYSDDNGYSWWMSNMVDTQPIEAQEPHVVELKDGRVMMLMRTYSGFVMRAYSKDQGATWSQGHAVPEVRLPPHSTSALNVKRIPSTGDLLLLRCVGGPKGPPALRTPLVSVISRDDGQTWEKERVIAGDPEGDYGYPSLLFLDDVAVVSYHALDGLHVARIGIGWFYGK
jgi:sialidase-1